MDASRSAPTSDPRDERDRLAFGILQKSLGIAALRAALELQVFDHLEERARPVSEIASAVGCPPASMARLLRVLEADEFVSEPVKDTFALGSLGKYLQRGTPSSERDFAIFALHPVRARALEHLAEAVRSGRTATEVAYGVPEFEFFAQNPEFASVFQKAMVNGTNSMTRAFLGAYSFEGIRQVADIGGGHGELLASVLGAYPAMKGILFDLPYAVEGARAHLSEMGLAGRCQVIGGSFFESVPPGADRYLLKSVIHNWPDSRATEILRNVAAAMTPRARLLIIERLLPDGPGPDSAFMMDLNMLAFPGGRERTRKEYEGLLESAQLRLSRVIATPAREILEATRSDESV